MFNHPINYLFLYWDISGKKTNIPMAKEIYSEDLFKLGEKKFNTE